MSHDDRSIPATERRLLQARQRGMMPVRRAPIALAGVAGGALGAAMSGGPNALLGMLERALGTGLSPSWAGAGGSIGAVSASGAVGAAGDPGAQVAAIIGATLAVSWPVMAGGVVGAALGAAAQTGGMLSWNRPRGSLGARLLSMSGPGAWGRAASGLAWTLAAMATAGVALWSQWATIASLPNMPLAGAARASVGVASVAVLAAFASLAAIAIVDALLSRARWQRSLAMSPQEAREEQRATDGDPLVRNHRRRAARQALRALQAHGAQVSLEQSSNAQRELPAPAGDPA